MQKRLVVDLTKISPQSKKDVANFLEDNPGQRIKMEEMTAEEFFSCWMTWHGLIGYNSDVLRLVAALVEQPAGKEMLRKHRPLT
jgi:hypothetical protein